MSDVMDKAKGPLKEMPLFEHECDKCTFLGGYLDKTAEYFDLYYCPQSALGSTIVARFGRDGDYISGMPKEGSKTDPLVEGQSRAKKLGFEAETRW